MHRLSKRITLTAALVGILAIGAGVTGALAATGQFSSDTSQPAGVATDISGTLSEHYALLRQPATPEDAIPTPSGNADYGQNPALARRLGDTGYYVIPGTDDSLCLVTAAGGGVCGKGATDPTILTAGICDDGFSTFRFVGLFPDGIAAVAITSQDGAVQKQIAVETNGASAEIPSSTAPLTISWNDANGEHSRRLPVPPGPMYCGPDSAPGS